VLKGKGGGTKRPTNVIAGELTYPVASLPRERKEAKLKLVENIVKHERRTLALFLLREGKEGDLGRMKEKKVKNELNWQFIHVGKRGGKGKRKRGKRVVAPALPTYSHKWKSGKGIGLDRKRQKMKWG